MQHLLIAVHQHAGQLLMYCDDLQVSLVLIDEVRCNASNTRLCLQARQRCCVLPCCFMLFTKANIRHSSHRAAMQVHLLSENRGSALETGTISRIKMVSSLKEMAQACHSKNIVGLMNCSLSLRNGFQGGRIAFPMLTMNVFAAVANCESALCSSVSYHSQYSGHCQLVASAYRGTESIWRGSAASQAENSCQGLRTNKDGLPL